MGSVVTQDGIHISIVADDNTFGILWLEDILIMHSGEQIHFHLEG